MRFIPRAEQNAQSERFSQWRRASSLALADSFFDGEPLPLEIAPRHWRLEGEVHEGRVLSRQTDSTRYFLGPQVCITRDDIRRVTWAANVESGRLMLTEYLHPHSLVPRSGGQLLAEGPIWRYHIALNKFTGEVSATWVTRSERGNQLWLDGSAVETEATAVDFPFFAFSQVPVGRIQTTEPPYGLLSYKCRKTGRIFMRRLQSGALEPEERLPVGETAGGASFGIVGEDVLVRVDLIRDGKLVPALLDSRDGGRSFSEAKPIDLSGYEHGFEPLPGYQQPIVDKGEAFHVPISLSNGEETAVLNYVVREDTLVEAIRTRGERGYGRLAVFPSTLGGENHFGNGVTDGHGLIMVLATEGHLLTSNSSAGGIHFPEAALLNHEMPLVAVYSASQCYSSGLVPNFVSMDYLYIEANEVGRPVSPYLHIETWDMPLPIPEARAKCDGAQVEVTIVRDADLEPGKVTFGFDDPTINITDVDVTSLRTAVVKTDSEDLKGKTLTFDVLTLFHRHYGEAVIE